MVSNSWCQIKPYRIDQRTVSFELKLKQKQGRCSFKKKKQILLRVLQRNLNFSPLSVNSRMLSSSPLPSATTALYMPASFLVTWVTISLYQEFITSKNYLREAKVVHVEAHTCGTVNVPTPDGSFTTCVISTPSLNHFIFVSLFMFVTCRSERKQPQDIG